MESIANFDPEIMALLSEYMTCSHEPGLELGSEFPSIYSSDHDMVPWNCLETLVFPNNVGGYYISDPVLASDYYLDTENGSYASPTQDESENALEPVSPPHWKPSLKRGPPTLELDTSPIKENANVAKVSPKKRSRMPTATNENVRKMQPRKAQRCNKSLDSEECKNRSLLNRQGSGGYSLEDDSVASQEIIEEEDNSSAKGTKTRASRGSATDPQSIYARKRRERINERLRILQNLVPNGTKVDISTMLEEAVQYVKFLQLQIKLLSSDELWMYAPIAYNGMSIGLDMKISLP